MAEWLNKIVDEVNREFDELPEWKKGSEPLQCDGDTDARGPAASTLQEPRSE